MQFAIHRICYSTTPCSRRLLKISFVIILPFTVSPSSLLGLVFKSSPILSGCLRKLKFKGPYPGPNRRAPLITFRCSLLKSSLKSVFEIKFHPSNSTTPSSVQFELLVFITCSSSAIFQSTNKWCNRPKAIFFGAPPCYAKDIWTDPVNFICLWKDSLFGRRKQAVRPPDCDPSDSAIFRNSNKEFKLSREIKFYFSIHRHRIKFSKPLTYIELLESHRLQPFSNL